MQRHTRATLGTRAVSLSAKRGKVTALRLLRAEDDYPQDHDRPVTRADCVRGPRPCPYVSCAHHLYLDVNAATGSLKLNHPGLEPDELTETCALDVEGATLDTVGALMNLTRERARQIEEIALKKMRLALPGVDALRFEPGPEGNDNE